MGVCVCVCVPDVLGERSVGTGGSSLQLNDNAHLINVADIKEYTPESGLTGRNSQKIARYKLFTNEN